MTQPTIPDFAADPLYELWAQCNPDQPELGWRCVDRLTVLDWAILNADAQPDVRAVVEFAADGSRTVVHVSTGE